MNLQIMSDLHFEFHRDGGASFIESLDPTDVDVLILAGDIFNAADGNMGNAFVLRAFAKKYPHVIYVTGNHEFYGTTPAKAERMIEGAISTAPNVHWLRSSAVDIECRGHRQRFLGDTLWFDDDPSSFRNRGFLNDFRVIRKFVPWVFERNQIAEHYLRGHVGPGDVVVTHHLPSQRSVHQRYARSALNHFFVHEMDSVIERQRPVLWVHGHSHSQADYLIGNCRVICNPFGYPSEVAASEFREKLVVTVGEIRTPTPR